MEGHIFKFGEGSTALILPKAWVDKSGLKASDSVYLSESESGNLIITATGTKKKSTDWITDSSVSPTLIGRRIGLHYMYGTTNLHIYSSDGFTRSQLDVIENTVHGSCSGFEITTQTSKEVVIEDLTNIKEVSLEKVIMRLRSIVGQEFSELENLDTYAIGKMEELINRFYMLGVRYINITQASDFFRYYSVLGALESIADSIAFISEEPSVRGMHIFEDMHKQFDLAFTGFTGNLKVIEEVTEMRASILKKIPRRKIGKFYTYILRNITDKISDVAEFGLKL